MRIFRGIGDESGQALPLVVAAAVVLIGFAGLAIDLGRVWVAKQQLQQAVDASAVAAGQYLPSSQTAYTNAITYAAYGATSKNPVTGAGVTAGQPIVTFRCVPNATGYVAATGTCPTDTSGKNCNPTGSATPSSTTCNAVNVTETATVSAGLLSLFIPHFTVKASSTAGNRDNTVVTNPLNVEVILDTTNSMSAGASDRNLSPSNSTSCSASVSGISSPYSPDKLDCAKAGVRALLQAMPYATVNGTSVADDDVGIVTFPALSSTLTGAPQTTYTPVSFTGTASTNSTSITGVSTNLSAYTTAPWGQAVTAGPVPAGGTTTIVSITRTGSNPTRYTVVLSNKPTSSGSKSFTFNEPTGTTTVAPYVLETPPTTSLSDETDCNSSDSFGVTYPPYAPYTNTTTGSEVGGIPASDLYSYGNNTAYTGSGYVDNYQGYEAVPLSGDYQTNGSLSNSSNLVKSVYWGQCTNGQFPGGDYYGLKDIGGQGSYLAGAITEAQYLLATSTRTTGPNGQPVTNAIIILSDGELNGIPKSDTTADGVDPGAPGNITATRTTPCIDAIDAANAARAAGTLIFTIAYDDDGESCDDGGGSGYYNGSAQTLMQDLATPTAGSKQYYYTESTAGDLTAAFQQAEETLNPGDSRLIPDCTQAPPNC